MLTKITIRNFKRFDEIEIELGSPVVFIGPNNSGKTSVLQALALWEVGLRHWNEKRAGKTAPEKRPGVTINRRDLVSVPVPDVNLLWRNLHVRDVRTVDGKPRTRNLRIDIIVEDITGYKPWKCGLEFDYANPESFYCRPLRLSNGRNPERMKVPEEAASVRIAFLPPMSGLAANETRLDEGAVNVRIGEGRTAEVLRNLCYRIREEKRTRWEALKARIESLFGTVLIEPQYIPERGEIVMAYREGGFILDLSSSGRGLQQTLLLLAYMYANPGAILLLDEPDAHLEILRQRQIYQLLTDAARQNGNQIIAASHSEIILNEAADRDMVIAFVGYPHRIDDRGSQALKALREIGFEQYYQAEQTGWVLYLEGSTDLAMLRAFARRLNRRDAEETLERPFVYYVGNRPGRVRDHFFGLREAVRGLKGIALFDRLDRGLPENLGATGLMWQRREIESYLCSEEALMAYAEASAEASAIIEYGPLFISKERERRSKAMQEAIREVQQALATLGRGSPWSPDIKASDDFLTPLFDKYFKKLELPNLMAKKNFHELVEFLPQKQIDREVSEKLDAIVNVAKKARPGRGA